MERALRSIHLPECRRIIPRLCRKVANASDKRAHRLLKIVRERRHCSDADFVKAAAARAVQLPKPDSRGLALLLQSAVTLQVVPVLPERHWPPDACWGVILAGDRRESVMLAGIPVMSPGQLKLVLAAVSELTELSPQVRAACIARIAFFFTWRAKRKPTKHLAASTLGAMIGKLVKAGCMAEDFKPLALAVLRRDPVTLEAMWRSLWRHEAWNDSMRQVFADAWMQSAYIKNIGDALVLAEALEYIQMGVRNLRMFEDVWDELVKLAEYTIAGRDIPWLDVARLLHFFCRQNMWDRPIYVSVAQRLVEELDSAPTQAVALLMRVFLRTEAMDPLMFQPVRRWERHLDDATWSTMVLYGFVNAPDNMNPDLREAVFTRWEGVLTNVASLLGRAQNIPQSTYELNLQRLRIGDFGPRFTPKILQRLGVPYEPDMQTPWIQHICEALSRREPNDIRPYQRSSGFMSYSLRTDTVVYSGETMMRSGAACFDDTSSVKGAAVGFLDHFFDRRKDVEFCALKKLEGLSAPDTTGSVHLYCDRLPCLSCIGAMAQFRKAFPGIDFHYACGDKF
eukprot:GEMP01026133.1.p1 GENE.GEMP01026133.1~~GEMP01026133.1.p1  ORF type:complete len:584 (+),score=108.56 GEMP01026133.1:52-1752(+)